MWPTNGKFFKQVLTLMILVTQISFASALPCQMNMPQQQQSQPMDHSAHQMMAMEMDNQAAVSTANSDCCNTDNHCFMSSCISLALVNQLTLLSTADCSQSSDFCRRFAIRKSPDTPYRPPILS